MDPIERIDRRAPTPLEPKKPSFFDKILSIITGFKDGLFSFFRSLAGRGSYVKVPDSEIDQKIDAISEKTLKKVRFKEDLTAMRTYNPDSAMPLNAEEKHVRRKNEELSRFRRIGEEYKISHSPFNESEIAERFIQKISHTNLSEEGIEKAFKGIQEGAFLINKTDEGLKLIIKRSSAYEIHPFEQLKDEDDMPLDAIKSEDRSYDNLRVFLGSFGILMKNLINPKSRFSGFSSETFLREFSLEEVKQFLMDRPDRSFTVLRSDKPDYTYMVLIKKEPLLPFFETTIDVIHYKFDKNDKIICNKGRIYPNFDNFLFEIGTTIGRGQIT